MSLSAVLSNAIERARGRAERARASPRTTSPTSTPKATRRKLAQQEAVVIDGRGAGARATDTTRVSTSS